MNNVRGIIAALITSLNDDESLKESGIRGQVRRLLDAGVDGMFCLGTNGEFYIMSESEKLEVVRIVVDEVAGQVPVYAGTGCVGTKDTVRLSKAAIDAGADVLSVITPYFAAASQDELVRHFVTVAEAVDAPVVLYNIPMRTGVNMAPATIAKLAEVPNIVGVKDSSGNFDNMLQYIEQTPDDFSVLSGNDGLILWNLLAGGAGGITAISNVYPKTMVAIYQEWKAGNISAARRAQDAIRPIRRTQRHGNPNTITKAAANLAGCDLGPCRAPFNHVPEEALAEIKSVLERTHAEGTF